MCRLLMCPDVPHVQALKWLAEAFPEAHANLMGASYSDRVAALVAKCLLDLPGANRLSEAALKLAKKSPHPFLKGLKVPMPPPPSS